MKEKKHVNEIITEKILSDLADNQIPWRKPWITGMPRNLVSKKNYRGINVVLLTLMGFSSPYWATYKQIKEMGGQVKEGQKGSPVVYWKLIDVDDYDSNSFDLTKKFPFLRYYTVFNTDQCDGLENKIPKMTIPNVVDPITSAESIIEGYKDKPPIEFNGGMAYYHPSKDLIKMPPMKTFVTTEGYYSTLFHECIHSTGHKKRLDRPGVSDCTIVDKDGLNYSKEELVAEIGAVFLLNSISMKGYWDNNVSYIKGWYSRLKDDPNLIIQASSQAQKAFDYILNIKEEMKGGEEN